MSGKGDGMMQEDHMYSATQTAYMGIRRMIFTTHALKPGQKLVESSIAQQLCVSRTPVREAIHLLLQDGVVERIQNRGTFVRIPDKADILMSYETAAASEGMICYTLAERVRLGEDMSETLHALEDCMDAMEAAFAADDLGTWVLLDRDFHRCLSRKCSNTIIRRIFDRTQEMLLSEIWGMPRLLNDKMLSNTDHRELVAAIGRGDPDTAQNIAINHQLRVRRNFGKRL